MFTADKTLKQRAQDCCRLVEGYGNIALYPEPVASEDQITARSRKRKPELSPVVTDAQASDRKIELETQFEITGTRVLMPEDRGHLESQVKLLRPAFEVISQHLEATASSPEERNLLYQKLTELIAAPYYVGAYTTVSLGVQKFVAPAVLREQAKTPQRAKAVMDMEKRQRLRAAIRRAAGGRELKASRAFANLIYDKVFAEVGILGKEGKKKWPSRKTIKNEIELMRKEGV